MYGRRIVYVQNFPPSDPRIRSWTLANSSWNKPHTENSERLRISQPKISKHKTWLLSNKNTRHGFHSSSHRNRKSQPGACSYRFAMMPDSGIRPPYGCTDKFIVVFCVPRRMCDISFTLRQLSSEPFPKYCAQLLYHSCLFNL
jgi:hypothetical protein